MRIERHSAHDSVPAALCLVGNRVRILTNAHVLYSVVNLYRNLVVLSGNNEVRDVEHMRSRKAHLMSDLLVVYENGCLDMRTFKSQNHTLFLPRQRNGNCASVPCVAHIMFVWS